MNEDEKSAKLSSGPLEGNRRMIPLERMGVPEPGCPLFIFRESKEGGSMVMCTERLRKRDR